MKYNENERGSVLLMVLMLVIVFTVLGMGLLSLNMSASKQFDKKEEDVQARHQAEMGVLHYQSRLKQKVKAHNLELKEIAKGSAVNKVTLINAENDAFCNDLNNVEYSVVPSKPNGANYNVKNIGEIDCSISEDAIITIESEGWTGENGKSLIEAELTLKIPDNSHITVGKDEVSGEGGNEGKPEEPPTSTGEVITEWPCKSKNSNNNIEDCYETLNGYVDVGEVTMKKGDLKFNDHFVAQSLRIEGGNGATITVAKDLYIKEILSVQTHGCIVVQGNFTVNEKIDSKTKLYIYVYGNAYLPKSIDLTSRNNEIHVNGNVFINGIKKVPNPFSPVPDENEHEGCVLTGPPPSSPTDLNLEDWEYEDGIDAKYK